MTMHAACPTSYRRDPRVHYAGRRLWRLSDFSLGAPRRLWYCGGMKQCDASPAAPTNVRLTQGVRAAG